MESSISAACVGRNNFDAKNTHVTGAIKMHDAFRVVYIIIFYLRQ
jgi:hypothetical protein